MDARAASWKDFPNNLRANVMCILFTSISDLPIDVVNKQGSSFKSQKILVKETYF